MTFARIRLNLFLCVELIVSVCCADAWGLPVHRFSQFSSNDGLDEFIVQSSLQARNGLMWFGTWNGLYSFDGYRFHCHSRSAGDVIPTNARFDQLAEASDSSIWMVSYDGVVLRYNPSTDLFTRISERNYFVSEYHMMADGHCWLQTDQNDLLLVRTSDAQPQCVDFFAAYHIAKPSRINQVTLDSRGRHWLLTEGGAFCYDPASQQCLCVSDQPSYDMIEFDQHYIWGGRWGIVFWLNDLGQHPQTFQLDTNSSIKHLTCCPDGTLVGLTSSDGFFLYQTSTHNLQHVTTAQCPALGSNDMREVFVDSRSELWLRTAGLGIVHYEPATGRCRRHVLYDTLGNRIELAGKEQTVIEDIHHNLWVHPSGGGLAWYNRATDQLELFYNPNLWRGWHNASPTLTMLSDRQGNLWFSSYDNGLEKASFQWYPFQLSNTDPPVEDVARVNLRGSFQDAEGMTWAASKDHVIRVYDREDRFFGCLCNDGQLRRNRQDHLGMAYAFLQSRDGTIWIGTKGQGLYMLTRQSQGRYDLRHFCYSSQDVYSLGSDKIYGLYEDRKGRIWVATYENGVSILDRENGYRFYNTHNELSSYPLISCYRTRCVRGDGRGNIWIGSTNGLLRCNDDFASPSQLRFKRFRHQTGDSTSISADDISDILFTPDHRNFVTSFGGGICEFFPQPDGSVQFSRFDQDVHDQLDNVLYSMVLDQRGDLWTVGEDALTRFDLTTGQCMHFNQQMLPLHLAFNEGRAICRSNGELLFPTVRGALHFFPDSLKADTYVPPIHFTRKGFRLDPSRRSFMAEFSALDYSMPDAILFAYRLVGFDEDWHYVGHQHSATYTNLPPGHFRLEVRSTNSAGLWLDNVASIPVEVIPAFSETLFAKCLLCLGILLILLIILWANYNVVRLRQKVGVEEQMAELKLKFFTNVSHELRTPLTLITGPLEQIRLRPDLSPQLAEQLGIISSNATHMSRLVNQILDFSRLQKDKMRLLVQPFDVVAFVEDHVRRFTLLAQTTNIHLQFSATVPQLILWGDTEKLMQVVDNLLGNAFKYTHAGHGIFVSVGEEQGQAVIVVRDEGIGIAPNRLQSLFERFGRPFRYTPTGLSSSGIGLSLTQGIVLLHQGNMDVQSQQGQGTCVTVHLPLGRDHFPADTEFLAGEEQLPVPPHSAPTEATESAPAAINVDSEENRLSILVVEDNADLRAFIRQTFANQYQVFEAADGREGLRMAKLQVPDLVISDVLMPLMDGFQFATQMHSLPELSHIPIILLTALSDNDSKLRGMDCGIEDYITKPFTASYLQARVANILQKRQLLQQYFLSRLSTLVSHPSASVHEPQPMPAGLPSPTSPDQRFLSLVLADIQQHLSDPDYSVESMADAANMSRSTFGRKLRAMMGQAPADLLRDMRLKRAATLIDEDELTVAQVAYEVGFNDPHYFGKCFKAYHGMTPTEYKARASRQ